MKILALAAWAAVLNLVLASSVSIAAPKAQPTGFNGIAFGTSFAAAKKKLGAKAKADKSPSAPIVNTLIQSEPPVALYGESFVVNYTFGTDDRLKVVYAFAKTPIGNFAVCRSHWSRITTGLKAQYGLPKDETSDIQTTTQFASSTYAFPNGNKIEALLMGCLIMLTYSAPGYTAKRYR